MRVLARSWLGDVRAIVRVARAGDGWSLDRGGIRADGNAPALPSHRGLRIEGAVERFVLDDWLALRGDGAGTATASGEGKTAVGLSCRRPTYASVTFELCGLSLVRCARRVASNDRPAGASMWTVPSAAGQVLIPEHSRGAQPLRATMERLVMEKRGVERRRRRRGAADPRNIPNLQVHVGELRLGTRALGTLDLKATRVPQGIRFDNACSTARRRTRKGRANG